MAKTRSAMVALANSWLGKNEADGSHKMIVDIYNQFLPHPRGYKLKYTDAWCAGTFSALAIKLGYTDIVPIECSCVRMIEKAKAMGIWIEEDNHVPKLAEAVLYDWNDNGVGDNKGSADHIGIVTYVNESNSTFVVVEGNYSNSVKKRTLSFDSRYIRGFVSPKYDEDGVVQAPEQTSGKSIEVVAREVIAGQWGKGADRKVALEKAGYDSVAVQTRVNQILNGSTTKPSTGTKNVISNDVARYHDNKVSGTYKTKTSLYLRHGAGTNKKAMVCIPKGTEVKCYGYYSASNGYKWLYIQVTLNGITYVGFSHSAYLEKK